MELALHLNMVHLAESFEETAQLVNTFSRFENSIKMSRQMFGLIVHTQYSSIVKRHRGICQVLHFTLKVSPSISLIILVSEWDLERLSNKIEVNNVVCLQTFCIRKEFRYSQPYSVVCTSDTEISVLGIIDQELLGRSVIVPMSFASSINMTHLSAQFEETVQLVGTFPTFQNSTVVRGPICGQVTKLGVGHRLFVCYGSREILKFTLKFSTNASLLVSIWDRDIERLFASIAVNNVIKLQSFRVRLLNGSNIFGSVQLYGIICTSETEITILGTVDNES